jgi:hypothetical protein
MSWICLLICVVLDSTCVNKLHKCNRTDVKKCCPINVCSTGGPQHFRVQFLKETNRKEDSLCFTISRHNFNSTFEILEII